MPDLIDEALTHIAERYRYENAILTNITQTRDEAEDPVHRRKAAELVEIVSDCIRRHTQLQAQLQEAGARSAPSRTASSSAATPSGQSLTSSGILWSPSSGCR